MAKLQGCNPDDGCCPYPYGLHMEYRSGSGGLRKLWLVWALIFLGLLTSLALAPGVAGAEERITYTRCLLDPENPQNCRLVYRAAEGPGPITEVPDSGSGLAFHALARHPDWSPDGGSLIFDDYPDTWMFDVESGQSAVFLPDSKSGSFSPDGSRIALVSNSTSSVPEPYSIFTVSRDGTDRQTVVEYPAHDPFGEVPGADQPMSVSWSPEGQRLVFTLLEFVEDPDGGFAQIAGLWSVNADGSGLTQLTQALLDRSDGGPVFSPDGSKIAFSRTQPVAGSFSRSEVFVMNSDGTSIEKLPISNLEQFGTFVVEAWSPDGSRLLLSGRPSHTVNSRMYVVPSAGGAATPFTDEAVAHRGEVGATWSADPVPVAIGLGPSGLTRESTATFSFAAIDEEDLDFECRLDDGAFVPCSSPRTLNGLSDGEHRFSVRALRDGQVVGVPVSRSWTVDTTSPSVILQSEPPTLSESRDAEFSFTSSEPEGASFECRLDGGAPFDCSSPHQETGLDLGLHGFEIVAFDAAGNASNPEFVEWEVVEETEPPIEEDCPPGTQATLAFGVIVALAQEQEGCFRPVTVEGIAAFEARGLIKVNGIGLEPASPGQRILLSPTMGQGRVWSEQPAIYRLGDIETPPLKVEFNGLTTAVAINKVFAIAEKTQISRFSESLGLGGGIGISLEFLTAGGGQTKINFKGTLPTKVLQKIPDGLGGQKPGVKGLTVELPVVFSNNSGTALALKVTVGEAWLGGAVKVKNLSASVNLVSGSLVGVSLSGGLVMNQSKGVKKISGKVSGLDSDATLEFVMSLRPGPSSHFGIVERFSVIPSNLARHVGGGFFLQRAGLEMSTASEGQAIYGKLAGLGTVSFGPRIQLDPVFDGFMATGDVNVSLLWAHNEAAKAAPHNLRAVYEGSAKILEVPVSNMKVTQLWPNKLTLTGGLNLGIPGWIGVGANITEAFFNPLDIASTRVKGRGELQALGKQLILDAVIGTSGYGVCFGPASGKVGFMFNISIENPTKVFSDSCDIGAITSAVASGLLKSSAEPVVEVRAGTITQVLVFKGDGGPPKVELSGPGGAGISTPATDERLSTDTGVVVQDDHRDTTFVALFRPKPGTWSATAREEGPDIISTRRAVNLPPIRIKATVKSVKVKKARKGSRKSGKGKRLLSWTSGPIPGQKIQFVEVAGTEMKVLATTRKRRGKVTYRPMSSVEPKRTIRALVLRNGVERTSRVVARYRSKTPALPGKATRIRLNGRHLTWKLDGVRETAVALTLPDGTNISRTVNRSALRLPVQVRKGQRIGVTIVGIDLFGRTGKVTATTIKRSR